MKAKAYDSYLSNVHLTIQRALLFYMTEFAFVPMLIFQFFYLYIFHFSDVICKRELWPVGETVTLGLSATVK